MLTMTPKEREQFLSDPHVGLISIAEEERGPLPVPSGMPGIRTGS